MLGSMQRLLFVLVIAFPLLGQSFPYGFPVFLPLLLLLSIVTCLLRISDEGFSGLLVGDPWFVAICTATFLSYVYGIVISVDVQGPYVLREMANGIVVILLILVMANSGWSTAQRDRLVKSFASLALLIGLFVGGIGSYKFWRLLSGEQLGFVREASSAGYPWGTSLVTDYNFFALTIMVAILSALFLSTGRRMPEQIFLGLAAAFLVGVGMLAGSRRFWVVAPLMIVIQLFWMVLRHGIRRNAVLINVLLLCIIGLPVAVYLYASDDFERMISTGWGLQERLLSILEPGREFGMSSRLLRWEFAVQQLQGFVPWFGSGFDYLNRFSCAFGECAGPGYPHFPILSAYLYGGVMAAIVAVLLYVYIMIAGLKILVDRGAIAWLFFPMLVAFVFGAISANGPLSIRSFLVLGTLCVGFLYALRIEKIRLEHGR